jgi:hypothetical protein
VSEEIYGPKREEATVRRRKLRKEEVHNSYCSPDNIRRIKPMGQKWAQHVVCMGEIRNAYKIVVGKTDIYPLKHNGYYIYHLL